MTRVKWAFRDRLTGWAFQRFSVYVAPFVIVLGSIAVLFWAPRQFDTTGMVALSFPVIPDPSATLSPAAAIARLRDAAPTARFSTHLAETPFWFMLTAPALGGAGPTLIDLPSRHAQTLSCWRTGPVPTPLGAADRHGTSGEMRANKAGFALRLDELGPQTQILCRGTFSGPAYITASATNAEELEVSALDFTQSASLITGGLLTLAIFVFVTAIINREWTYVIFAAWLVGNLRLSANAMGFDTEWMGWLIPPDHIALLREFTFASYYVLTTTLFVELFRRELKTIGLRWSLHAVRYGGCLLMIAACTLSYAHFIPVLWACASFCILVLTYFLVQLFIKARSRTVLWYVASMGIVLFATLSQVLAAALGVKALAGALSPVVTALSSSMLCAFAIAERMREERERRRQMQIELRNTYDVTPIGLFTLSGDSAFLRANPALHSMLGLPQQHHGAHRWADYFAPGAERALAELLERDDSASIEIEVQPARRQRRGATRCERFARTASSKARSRT